MTIFRHLKNKKGTTLAELLIAIVIALGLALGAGSYLVYSFRTTADLEQIGEEGLTVNTTIQYIRKKVNEGDVLYIDPLDSFSLYIGRRNSAEVPNIADPTVWTRFRFDPNDDNKFYYEDYDGSNPREITTQLTNVNFSFPSTDGLDNVVQIVVTYNKGDRVGIKETYYVTAINMVRNSGNSQRVPPA